MFDWTHQPEIEVVINFPNYLNLSISNFNLKISIGVGATDYSLSLCILPLYLLNGEIIQNGREDNKRLSSNIFQYPTEHSLDSFEPPVSKKELTFIKSCCFVDVELSLGGTLTTGWLWKMHKIEITGATFR